MLPVTATFAASVPEKIRIFMASWSYAKGESKLIDTSFIKNKNKKKLFYFLSVFTFYINLGMSILIFFFKYMQILFVKLLMEGI